MQKWDLSHAFTEIDDKYILEAEEFCQKKRTSKKKKIMAAGILAAFLVSSGFSTYAAIDYLKQRMERMTPQEKQQYVSEIEAADVEKNTYTREFTDEERERMEQLWQLYEAGKAEPEGELLRVTDESDVRSDRLCLLIRNSTFYLPEAPMSDEQLLEYIDYCYKLEYSLETSTQHEKQSEYIEDTIISEEEAKENVRKVVEKLFDTDIADYAWNIQLSQDQLEDRVSSLYLFDVGITNRKNYYSGVVDGKTGKVTAIAIEDQGLTFMKQDAPMELEYFKSYAEQAEHYASVYMDYNAEWKKKELIYHINENGNLMIGIVDYYFEGENGEKCVIQKSSINKEFINIGSVEPYEQLEWEEGQENGTQKGEWKRIVLD